MEPNLSFFANTSDNNVVYNPVDNYYININNTDVFVFTGGGILGLLPVPICAAGSRDATIKPINNSFVIPQLYIEKEISMHNVQLAGQNNNRFCLAVKVEGTASSDIYIEAWDDDTLSTYETEILAGSENNNYKSNINVVSTTFNEPSSNWDGNSPYAGFIRGYEERVGLANLSSVTDSILYFNVYVRLETDSPTFHNSPVFCFRYLYT